jgi:hypothetical protein
METIKIYFNRIDVPELPANKYDAIKRDKLHYILFHHTGWFLADKKDCIEIKG